MKDFGVLGSGISGSTIAKLLSNKYENYLIKTNWAYLFVLKQN